MSLEDVERIGSHSLPAFPFQSPQCHLGGQGCAAAASESQGNGGASPELKLVEHLGISGSVFILPSMVLRGYSLATIELANTCKHHSRKTGESQACCNQGSKPVTIYWTTLWEQSSLIKMAE